KLPAASGPCPDSSFSILLYKEIVKDFFQILDAGRRSLAAGRKPMPHMPVKYIPIIYSGPPKAPFIGELAAKGGLRG
uniref:hypothetical protein n=1 Tax=uncultured Megasphaera sp. TaxID=165188 RepID=UPI0025DAD9CC